MMKNYPLHPGQTHAQPLYAQIPLEEYERLMRENKRLKDVLKRHGITHAFTYNLLNFSASVKGTMEMFTPGFPLS